MTQPSTTELFPMSQQRKQFLHDVFVTAIEGGITYWSFRSEYSWSVAGPGAVTGVKLPDPDLDGFYATISPSEGGWDIFDDHAQNRADLRIDREVIARGTNLLVDAVIAAAKSEDPTADFSAKYFRQFVLAWLSDGVDGDYDAMVADCVVQLGLFGKLVFG